MARRKAKTASRDLVRNVIHLHQMFPGGIIPAAGNSAAGRPERTARREILTAEAPRPAHPILTIVPRPRGKRLPRMAK